MLIQHQGVVNFLLAMLDTPGFDGNDVFFAVTTICFDISVLEIFCPLIVGATCVLVGEETKYNGMKLIQLIEQWPVTVLQVSFGFGIDVILSDKSKATPSLWRLLLECSWKGKSGLKALCGGEPLPISLANSLLPKVSELWNMYGPVMF